MTVGIYEIRNLVNNKVYIGLSTSIENRLLFHKRRLVQNTHKNKHLQSSFNKNGKDNFSFEIIEECNEDDLSSKEKLWIEIFASHNRDFGYNKTYGGEFGRLSDEIYKGYSDRLKGCTISEEQKSKISKTLTGRKRPKEEIEKAALSCRKLDDVTESLIVRMYIDSGCSHYKFISNELDIKYTTIRSVIVRYKKENKL